MTHSMLKNSLRLIFLLLVNCLVFIVLFAIAEIGYRIYSDGASNTISTLGDFFNKAPYSNLGTGNWVIFDEELGYRLNPSQKGINSLSIRHGEISIPKPAGTKRILYLGDSIPWDRGGFVDQSRTALQKQGSYEIINAAVQGYTSYQEVLFYEKYLQPIQPDLVIWTYCLNDNYTFLHHFNEKAQMLWTKEAEASLKLNSSWDLLLSKSYILTRLHMAFLAQPEQYQKTGHTIFSWQDSIDFNIAWKKYSWKNHEQQIIKLKKILETQNAALAVVIFPYEPQLLIQDSEKHIDYITKPQQYLTDLCRKYSIPCLDLYPTFAERYAQKATLYRDGIHLNSDGHVLATQEILSFLHNAELLPTTP